MSPDEHDRAVARTSHLPHLLAALVAGRLADSPPGHLALSGQGVRDVTRIAAGDPELWMQIVTGNAPAVVHLLGEVRDQLDALIAAVSQGKRDVLGEILARGVAGTAAIPGKHGGPAPLTASVFVSVPDQAGRAGAAVRRRRRDRRQHRGRAHRPRPGPAHRTRRTGRRRGQQRAPAGLSRISGMGDPPVGSAPVSLLPDHAFDRLVIAIDGPSGSGKSSTSRGVAQRLGLRYLDTGAMFRAMTWWLLREGVDVHDQAAVAARVEEPEILSGTDPTGPSILVDGVDVGLAIRSDDVTAAVSPVSTVPEVRARLLELQREIIGEGGIVVEGRDIGSVVAPDADVKVFLTADAAARAERRAAEAGGDADLGAYPRVAAGPRRDRLGAAPRHR